jgi:glyoxylate/hydroxypyruvate reductase
MALILHVGPRRAQWWKDTMQSLIPDLEVRGWDDPGDPADVEFAVVWKHPAGGLLRFPNLKCIVSIGAGVDHVLVDPDLPKGVPIVRTIGDDLRQRMREYVALHVLRLHRRLPEIEASQPKREWNQIIEPPAPERTVGIMGLGFMGRYCADALVALGFDVLGWSREKKDIAGITCFGGAEFDAFLAHTQILVCLLPLTPETDSILNRDLFAKLPEGACVINAGRGEHLVEGDLIEALDSGHIRGATLDVFRTEPLPNDHPYWDHPNVLVTPHVASLIDPLAGGTVIAKNIQLFRAGKPVPDMIDPGKGY